MQLGLIRSPHPCSSLTHAGSYAGKGPLGQIGLITPSPPLLVTLSAALTSATFVALVQTLVKAQKGDLSPRCGATCAQTCRACAGVYWQRRLHLHHAATHRAAMEQLS